MDAMETSGFALRFAFWRGLVRFAGAIACLVMAAGVLTALSVHQSQTLKQQMANFCATFHFGQAASPAEIAKSAREHDYRFLQTSTAVTVYQYSWTGTRWSCTVRLNDGRVSATRFRGQSLGGD